jgi:hypothetical protein
MLHVDNRGVEEGEDFGMTISQTPELDYPDVHVYADGSYITVRILLDLARQRRGEIASGRQAPLGIMPTYHAQ